MKTYALIASIFAALIFTPRAEAACGQFEVAKGDITLTSAATHQTAAIAPGAKICSGDTVIAGANSRAKIKMEDGNELNISPDSKIVFENYQYEPAQNKKKVLLNILQGKVRAATQRESMYNDKASDGSDNSFQVKTKSAVAGVRGTDFLTSYDPKTQASAVVTFRGTVEFGQPGPNGTIANSVAVKAGMTTSLSAGQLPAAPKSVPPAQLQQINSSSTSAPSSSAASTSTSTSNAAPATRAPASSGTSMLSGVGDELKGADTSGTSSLPKTTSLPIADIPKPVVNPPPLPPQVSTALQNTGPVKVNIGITLPATK